MCNVIVVVLFSRSATRRPPDELAQHFRLYTLYILYIVYYTLTVYVTMQVENEMSNVVGTCRTYI